MKSRILLSVVAGVMSVDKIVNEISDCATGLQFCEPLGNLNLRGFAK